MDMHVNPEVFGQISSSIEKHCSNVTFMTDMLLSRLNLAHNDFDDVNFDRTQSAALRTKQKIETLAMTISALKNDMRELEMMVLEYLDGGYRG